MGSYVYQATLLFEYRLKRDDLAYMYAFSSREIAVFFVYFLGGMDGYEHIKGIIVNLLSKKAKQILSTRAKLLLFHFLWMKKKKLHFKHD